MKVLLISDADYHTMTYDNLQGILFGIFEEKGAEIETLEIGERNLLFCKGCFECWVKTPGECVIKDLAGQLNNRFMNSDVVIYISPVVFGQFSANIKNAIDRTLPNILPFFKTVENGASSHHLRYKSYPKQIIIGYGEEIDAPDQQLFNDIINKHRHGLEILIYTGLDDNQKIASAFQQIKLARVEGAI